MDSSRFQVVIPDPCLQCNSTELGILQDRFEHSGEDFWVYRTKSVKHCAKCYKKPGFLTQVGCAMIGGCQLFESLFVDDVQNINDVYGFVDVPIPCKTVGVVERAIHASSVSEKGTLFRSHGTFIHHLSNLDCDELLKQSLCRWAPPAMMGFNLDLPGSRRFLSAGQPSPTECSPPPNSVSPNVDRYSEQLTFSGNPDVEDGRMRGTQLNGDEYGVETRVSNQLGEAVCGPSEPRILATQIGPDLIPTEVMQSTAENLQAGLAKRVKPLPFRADKKMKLKIDKTVTRIITEVFPAWRIKEWREQHPCLEDMKSKKWNPARFRNAFAECMSDVSARIEQEFQIKTNEALPAKGKAPRPIIQTGDKGQIFMMLPVKCFEELLFSYFESASIKHVDKHSAMKRVAAHLRMDGAHVVEGDGSAWDACCNAEIRSMTENRILEHIIEVLGEDAEVPRGWMVKCLRDMQKKKIKGKAKVDNSKAFAPFKVLIEAIRQSGHRGTSAFNWLINYVGWLCVLADDPWELVAKSKTGKLFENYHSAVDHCVYRLRYSFEGDDSAISTTENLNRAYIEEAWTSLGFRMKLVYVENKMTFTGYDFLCDDKGPVGVQIPEIPRNIASSSWSCSSELKSHPEKVHVIGAAAMLARAENFKDCGPLSRYFAQLGLAHMHEAQDFAIGDAEAVGLGIQPVHSVVARLNELSDEASVMSEDVRRLAEVVGFKPTREQEALLLSCHFDTPDADEARYLIPQHLWDPASFEQARRSP